MMKHISASLLRGLLSAGVIFFGVAPAAELGPDAMAPRHRHDVAVLAYVLEGTVENIGEEGKAATVPIR